MGGIMKEHPFVPVLFVDREGTILQDTRLDGFGKVHWIPGVFAGLSKIRKFGDFSLVMLSQQMGVGTAAFSRESFLPVHQWVLDTLAGERICFDDVHVDFSLEGDNCPGHLPSPSLLASYTAGAYDLDHSFLIGGKLMDVELASSLGCKVILFAEKQAGAALLADRKELAPAVVFISDDWQEIASFLVGGEEREDRKATIIRNTAETRITLSVNLDGTGKGNMHTGIGFLDHMLAQVLRHSQIDMDLSADGDLEVDEHHTVEDIAIVMGSAIKQALGDKWGISRYGFDLLPMDDVLAQGAIDFSGRPFFHWNVPFRREYVGTFPTEMFGHFFKSFSDAAACNLDLKVSQGNAHHMIEAVFKCFAKSLKMAVHRYPYSNELPSTKGVL